MDIKVVKLIVRGRVQGVGYRNAIYGMVIDKLPEIRGFVKNLANGDVEILAIGEGRDIKTVVNFAYMGSRLSKVESVEVIEINLENQNSFNSFVIAY